MLFKEIKENNGWIIVEYSSTWRYGYDFILDAAQTIIDTDFKDDLQSVSITEIIGAPNVEKIDDVREANNVLRDCEPVAKECGRLTISGISSIMECPIQICFFNQTNNVRLLCPVREYFEQNGEHVFDNYLNSIEIRAYCKDTERRTMEELGRNNWTTDNDYYDNSVDEEYAVGEGEN